MAIAVVGGGYSAATTLRSILELAADRGNLYKYDIHWLLRRPRSEGMPYSVDDDEHLQQRAALGEMANGISEHTAGGGGGGKGAG